MRILQKPLRRIEIEEIGEEENQTKKSNPTLDSQSAEKRALIEQEEKNFQRMLQGEAKEHELKHHIRKPPGFEQKTPKSPEPVKPIEITELPPVPTNPFKFKKDWKLLASKFDLLAEYVKVSY